MSLARYMEIALGHPQHGYYITRDPLGRSKEPRGGDFITAPEISQMFGEILGLWAVHAWQNMGMPLPLRLIELGPGRGTLMADMVRAMAVVPQLEDAIEVHLVEISPVLRDIQRKTLAKQGITQVFWHDHLETVPQEPALYIGNEFLDALAFHQFEKRDGQWFERMVGLDATGQLTLGLSPLPVENPLMGTLLLQAPDGAVFERSPAREAQATALAQRVQQAAGYALLIDYGSANSGLGDSFQAVAAHAYTNPFADPGTADLTSHVDFEVLGLRALAAGTKVFGPIGQGDFLQALGIEVRAQRLAAGRTQKATQDIEAALNRLIAPKAMGALFKVLIIASSALPAPAPFME